jgi:WD40 repeat protein/tetratricopeptide (TPR) repeat protein
MLYKAFMSYSDAADRNFAPALQSALHRLVRPWFRLRAMRVFRDKTSLSATPALWPLIEAALEESEYFLLLASPEAAHSPWVMREVDWWLKNRSTRQILILLTSGDLVWDAEAGDFNRERSTALPGNLVGQFHDEPLYVDFRWAKTQEVLSLRHVQFRAGVLDIAATLHGKPKDELDGEDVRQHRTARVLASAAVFAIAASAVDAFWQAHVATKERDEVKIEAKLNAAGELAANALNAIGVDPERSLLLALESGFASASVNTPISGETEAALHRAILASHVRATLSGFDGFVTQAAFSPDGRQVAIVDASHVYLYDPVTGRRQLTLPDSAGRALGVAFSPRGDSLALAGRDGTARLWDLASAKVSRSFRADNKILWSAAFSPDGTRLATASRGGTVSIWDIGTGERLFELHGHTADVFAVVFNRDGTRMASASADGTAKVWDPATGRELLKISDNGTIHGVAFSPDGKSLALVTFNGDVTLSDAGTGRKIKALEGHTASVFGVSFSPDGKLLATASQDKTIKLWDTSSGKERYTLLGHAEVVASVAFSADGTRLVSTSGDSTARIWDVVTEPESPTLNGHRDHVLDIAFNAPGTLLATASADNTAKIWNAVTGEELRTLVGHTAAVKGIAFSPDGKRVATSSADKSAMVWEVETSRRLITLSGHQSEVNAITYSRDNLRIATAGTDGTARVWDAASGRELAKFEVPSAKIESVEFSPDGSRLAVGTYSTSPDPQTIVRVWGVDSHAVVLDLPGDFLWVNRVMFSPDGKSLATTGSTAPFAVIVWDAHSGNKMTQLVGHTSGILGLAFSPDGTRLASSSDHGAAKIWDLASGRELFALEGHSNAINSIKFSADGRHLATAGDDDTARTYSLDADELMAVAESRVTRPLSPLECRAYLRLEDCSGTVSSRLWMSRQTMDKNAPDASIAEFRGDLEHAHVSSAEALARAMLAAIHMREGREQARVGEVTLAQSSFARAMESKAVTHIDPLIEARRLTAAGQVALGIVYDSTEQYDKSIAVYEQAAAVYPTESTFTRLGDMYRLKKSFGRATEYLNKAIALDPQDEWPRRVLGIALRQDGKYQDAEETLKLAISLHPTRWSWEELARAYRSQGKYAEAIESWNKTKAMDANYVDAYWSTSSIYQDDMYDFEAAYREAAKAIELRPGDAADRANFAEACLTSGHFEIALREAGDVLASPDSAADLNDGERVAMRFVVLASLMLEGKTKQADGQLADLVEYYNSLPANYRNDWSYRGTGVFLRRQSMSEATRSLLEKVLSVIEQGDKSKPLGVTGL